MIKFTTASGATYLYDEQKNRVQRLSGPYSPGIDYVAVPDGKWQTLTSIGPITVGQSVSMTFTTNKWRLTTPVTHIEVDADAPVRYAHVAGTQVKLQVSGEEIGLDE